MLKIIDKLWSALSFATCPVCSGTGTDPNTSERCDNCGGGGRVD
jgi:DnaJ-class molecular chaperone